MTANNFEIGIVIVFILRAVSSASSAEPGTITNVGKLLFDLDAGGDDAVALLMALEAERLGDGPEVIAITCVNGNANVDQVALNILKVLKVAGRLDIPVYKGASHPLVRANRRDFYFGEDGFGDFDFPDAPSADFLQPKHAAIAMIDLVKEYPRELTIVALGPLTNIALAIRLCPSFLEEVQQLIIMGGSTEGLGNAGPGREFNFVADPHANSVVFNSSKLPHPVTLVPIETTDRSYVSMAFRMSLSQFNNMRVWLIDNAGANTLNPEAEYWHSADAVATVIALTSGSVVTKSGLYHSDPICEGLKTAGMILVDYKNLTGEAPNTNLIQNVDRHLFEHLLFRYFST